MLTEPLEERCLLSVYSVQNVDNAGDYSLRWAIEQANAYPDVDTIEFSLPEAGSQTIQLTEPLPEIVNPVVIDGWSQRGIGDDPVIHINGTNAGDGAHGLVIEAGDSRVRGLIIDGFSSSGIYVSSANNEISGNVISGNKDANLNIAGAAATNNTVTDNLIGTNLAGDEANARSGWGVIIHNDASSNSVEGNTIVGTDKSAVSVQGANDTRIIGNNVGTDTDGSRRLGPGGVWIVSGSLRTRIEGNTFGAHIDISAGSNETLVADNWIGVNSIGTPIAGSSAFVSVDNASDNHIVENTIAYHDGPGVAIVGDSEHNEIRGNSIYSNSGLGIDLGSNGVTSNDVGDSDSGPNGYLNFPVIATVEYGANYYTITGTFDSLPNTAVIIDFYSSAFPNGSAHGEGERYLGALHGMTDSGGRFSFTHDLPIGDDSHRFLSATATCLGNTSEFSPVYPPFIVTNTNNSGPGSLRQAIAAANTAEHDVEITFAIPATDWGFVDLDGDRQRDVFIVIPSSPLPDVHNQHGHPIAIDGRTQLERTGDTNADGPEIVLYGSLAGEDTDGIRVSSDRNVIAGLQIVAFSGDGIEIAHGDHNSIEACHVGTDLLPIGHAGNGGHGVNINGGSFNTIGGDQISGRNIISGNSKRGVMISGNGADDNQVLGNYIGTSADGNTASPNGWIGVGVYNGHGTLIKDNLVSGNSGRGIGLMETTDSLVQGNTLGLAANGGLLPNGPVGGGAIQLEGATNAHILDNTVCGNESMGIWVTLSSTGTLIEQNRVERNTLTGILVGTAQNQIISNTVVANDAHGIWLNGGGAVDNTVASNDVRGNSGTGIRIGRGAANNIVGSEAAATGNEGELNIVTDNKIGISVFDDNATNSSGNTIRGNRVFANLDLDIDLGEDGPTGNDADDLDSGPNALQNSPELASFQIGTSHTVITGRLDSQPGAYVVDFYNSSGQWLGEAEVAISASSVDGQVPDAYFHAEFHASTAAFDTIVATATNRGTGDTSEFSEPLVARPNLYVVTNTNDQGPGSLRQAILNANEAEEDATIVFNISDIDPGFVDIDSTDGGDLSKDVFVITQGTPLPPIDNPVAAVTIDGYSQALFTGESNLDGPEVILALDTSNGHGLLVESNSNVVQSLGITFTGSSDGFAAIAIAGSDNSISNSVIGWSSDSLPEFDGNGHLGIEVTGPNNTIGGSGSTEGNEIHTFDGVRIVGQDAAGNVVIGNRLLGGLALYDPPDVLDFTQIEHLVYISIVATAAWQSGQAIAVEDAPNTIIGGLHAGEGNEITAYLRPLTITDPGAGNARVVGNSIHNCFGGVWISNVSAVRFQGNDIYDNTLSTSVQASFSANFFDTLLRFAPGVGILHAALALDQCEGAVIGGTTFAQQNTFRGGVTGIDISGGLDHVLQGNRITENMTGVILKDATGMVVGGVGSGEKNVIIGNLRDGVSVRGGSQHNSIRGNSIVDNGVSEDHTGMGINLVVRRQVSTDIVTANDRDDRDSGPNMLQNYPVLGAASAGDATSIQGQLDSQPGDYVIDFYANSTVDPTGHGEGERWIGSTVVVVTDERVNRRNDKDSIGRIQDAFFDVKLDVATEMGEYITATATNLDTGDTSEFSAAIEAVQSEFVVTSTADSGPGSLRRAIELANQTTVPATIVFRIDPNDAGNHSEDIDGDTEPDVLVIAPTEALPQINNPNVGIMIDGNSQAEAYGDTNSDGPEIVLSGENAPGFTTGLNVYHVGNTIRGVNLTDWRYGIQVHGDNNGIENSVVEAAGIGVRVYGTGNHVTGNAVYGNGSDVSGYGIMADRSSVATSIIENTITGTRVGVVVHGDETSVVGNRIEANQIGIDVLNAPGVSSIHVEIVDNVVTQNERGVLLGRKPNGLIMHNEITGNELDGIRIAVSPDSVLTVVDNSIHGNGGDGISIGGGHVSVRQNGISGNNGLGINLTTSGDEGVTPNDTDDRDMGANGLQNYPVLQSVAAGTATHAAGYLDSTPGLYVIDFYANSEADESGHGEGERWIGSTTVEIPRKRFGGQYMDVAFNVSDLAETIPGEWITATATLIDNGPRTETSEFSLAVEAADDSAEPIESAAAFDVAHMLGDTDLMAAASSSPALVSIDLLMASWLFDRASEHESPMVSSRGADINRGGEIRNTDEFFSRFERKSEESDLLLDITELLSTRI